MEKTNNEIMVTRPDIAPYNSFALSELGDRASMVKITNALISPDKKIDEMIEKEIEVAGAFWDMASFEDSETKESIRSPLTILIDTAGKSYSTYSPSFNSAMSIVTGAFGENVFPLKIKVISRKSNNGQNKYLTLKVVE